MPKWNRFRFFGVGWLGHQPGTDRVDEHLGGVDGGHAGGTVSPLLLSRLGADPAVGSGPLATVIQDLLSLAIYFALAGYFVL